jgi:ABC-type branched-subunit amino acid transport system substrate-binding protein
MKKLLSVRIGLCALLMFALVPLTNSLAAEQNVLKIGLITSATGAMAPAFKSLLNAAKPAEDLFNQRGGVTINGQKYQIKIVTQDDQSSPPGGISAINKLIQDGVKFTYAPQFAVTNMAISPIAEEAKILRIKGLGIGKEEVNPTLRYSFYADADIYVLPTLYNYLTKKYPYAKKIAIISPTAEQICGVL